jgi:hypothetical protein
MSKVLPAVHYYGADMTTNWLRTLLLAIPPVRQRYDLFRQISIERDALRTALNRAQAALLAPEPEAVAERYAELHLAWRGGFSRNLPENLHLIDLQENSAKLESVVVAEQARAAINPAIAGMLESMFLEIDRDRAFARYLASKDFKTTVLLLEMVDINRQAKICEVGGGPGFLPWALSQSGFTSVDLFEPNAEYITGTGYLCSRADGGVIAIYNILDEWHRAGRIYNAIITKNCIHHFYNIALVAASLRQRLAPGGRWLALREWFADTPEETYRLIATHPYCQPHRLYEWPFPAASYVDAIELGGFRLIGVVPLSYAGSCIATWSEADWDAKTLTDNAAFEDLLVVDPQRTVMRFWAETFKIRAGAAVKRDYTLPQAFVFERV